jgi:hypothetical protein
MSAHRKTDHEQVRALYASGVRLDALAATLGISVQRISQVAGNTLRRARIAAIKRRDQETITEVLSRMNWSCPCAPSSAAISTGAAPGSPALPLSASLDA